MTSVAATTLIELISKFVPSTWRNEALPASTSETFKLFDVAPNTSEFSMVTKQLRSEGFNPQSVQRLENIYMFGRYIIRMQQLLCKNPSGIVERQRYVCIKDTDVNTLGMHNLDCRILKLDPNDFNLYGSPTEADARKKFASPIMVVFRVARENHISTLDCELYPEYLIKYNR